MQAIAMTVVALAVGLLIGSMAVRHRDRAVQPDLEARLDVQAAEMRRLADAAAGRDLAGEQLRAGIEASRRLLEEGRVRELERATKEAEDREVIRRLSTVLAGGTARGRAGENVLREHLSQLPPGMLVTDMRVGGKVVEFGLLLPDGRRLPVDSKWTAPAELAALDSAADPLEKEARVRDVEKAVAARAAEVAQYIDPAVTAPVAVAAIPDAAYAVLRRAHAQAYQKGVVIVPYSSATPILLFLYSLTQRFGAQRFGEIEDMQASLDDVAGLLEAMEAIVENRFARAGVMISSGAEDFRSNLGKARGSIARARSSAPRDDGGSSPEPLSVVG
jgi:DNA anti-recombination protein RmuC